MTTSGREDPGPVDREGLTRFGSTVAVAVVGTLISSAVLSLTRLQPVAVFAVAAGVVLLVVTNLWLRPTTMAHTAVGWTGHLRLTRTGHDIDGENDPSPESDVPNVHVTYEGDIDFYAVTVAEWTGDTPKPRQCATRGKTQILSRGEAESIRPEIGLQLCPHTQDRR